MLVAKHRSQFLFVRLSFKVILQDESLGKLSTESFLKFHDARKWELKAETEQTPNVRAQGCYQA